MRRRPAAVLRVVQRGWMLAQAEHARRARTPGPRWETPGAVRFDLHRIAVAVAKRTEGKVGR